MWTLCSRACLPALTVMASINWSLQEFVPTTRARLVFLISLSTVLCMTQQQNTNYYLSPEDYNLLPKRFLQKYTRAPPHDGSAILFQTWENQTPETNMMVEEEEVRRCMQNSSSNWNLLEPLRRKSEICSCPFSECGSRMSWYDLLLVCFIVMMRRLTLCVCSVWSRTFPTLNS